MLNIFSLFMHSLYFICTPRGGGREREHNCFHHKNLFNIYNKSGFRLVLERKSLFPETSLSIMAVEKKESFSIAKQL